MTNLAVRPKADVSAHSGGADLYVVFTVADAHYAMPASLVLQMESYAGATRVPGTAPFVVGVMPVRGRIVPVVDLRVRFGLPPVQPTLDSRVVVGQIGERAVALLADSAREVVRISPGDLAPPPRLPNDASGGFVHAVAHVGKRMLLILDFARVIGEESIDVE